MAVFATSLLMVCFAVWIADSQAALPPYVKPCSRHDPNLNQCALESSKAAFAYVAEKGDRKYGAPVLDPLVVTSMDIIQAGLNIHFEDVKYLGIKNMVPTVARIGLDKRREEFDFLAPKIVITFKYKVSGKILILPISGEGTGVMTLTHMKVALAHDFDLEKRKNGKLHMVIKNTRLDSFPSHMTIKLENLFNGDKRLGDTMNLFINENWREIYKDIGPPFNAAVAQAADQIYNGIMKVVPYDEVYPEQV